jgi:hypothetical protein
MDLVTTYTHDSELQAVTAPSLITQITTAHAKRQYFVVFPSTCLVTAVNNVDSSAFVPMPLPAGKYYSTELTAPAVLIITSRHRAHRKHPISNSNSIVAYVFIAVGMCLLNCCPEMVAVYSFTT